MANINRRLFLKGTTSVGFLGAAGVLNSLSGMQAFAAETGGYKAMVCIFLKGGMDHADVILPTDQASFDLLRDTRRGIMNGYNVDNPNSTRNREALLPLDAVNAANFGGRTFGLPTSLAPLHDMFTSGELAVLGGVGPLIEPVTRTQFKAKSAAIPKRLFSHNDQQSTWMSLGVEGSRQGWGGKFADTMLEATPSANPTFAAITTTGNDVFLAGETVRQFRSPTKGATGLDIINQRGRLGGHANAEETRARINRHLERSDYATGNLYERDYASANSRAIDNNRAFGEAMENATPIQTAFPSSSLGKQLQTVAHTINLRSQLNVNRQIFYTSIGGFDTHSGQAGKMPGLQMQIAEALAAFRSAMIEIGAWNDVTAFTMSDFGRTTIDNGDGTDHGWGAHHFVAGGSVAGQRIYGDLVEQDIASENYTDQRGRLIPSISVEQYAGTLGRWFGLDNTELMSALPNLANFDNPDLGFMGLNSV